MKLQKTTLISLLTFILLLSVTIGHFLPPTGVLIIPVTISLMTGVIIFTNNEFNILTKSILCYLYIGLNDIGIKLFAGGINDSEGTGWVHLMLFIGLVPSLIMLLIGVFQDKRSTISTNVISILLFISLIFIHLQIFENLGMGD
jgi:hypothetical protein